MGRHVTHNVATAFFVVGVAQLAFGLCIIVTTAVFGSKIDASVVEPYWSGLPLMLLGVVSIIVGVMRTSGIVVTYLVLAFFTTVVMLLSALFTGLASGMYNTAVDYMDAFGCFNQGDDCVCYTTSLFTGNSPREIYDGVTCGNLTSVHILLEVLVALSVVGMVVALIGIFLAGYAHCRRDILSERLRESEENLRRKEVRKEDRHKRKSTENLRTVVVDKPRDESPRHYKKNRPKAERSPETTHYHRNKPAPNISSRPTTPEPQRVSNRPAYVDDVNQTQDLSQTVPHVE